MLNPDTLALASTAADASHPMLDKLTGIWPEIVLAIAATICLFMGMNRHVALRRLTWWVAALGLVIAALISTFEPDTVGTATTLGAAMGGYVKPMIALIGLVLLLVAAQIPEILAATKANEIDKPNFDPGQVVRGEFFAFFLLSIAGAMLCAGADDLVWLFLALELTSLPTYVLVATARDRVEAQEAGVKYFFLGALSAAMFLYGFSLIYGATGFTQFDQIHAYVLENGMSPLFIMGLLLAVIGIAFKIAAFPMHFYAADVYHGANIGVTAFLAFVPKTAGFVSLILLLGLIQGVSDDANPASTLAGISGTQALTYVLWFMAAATMTLGNALGLLQNNVKRVLAYSSIAHSGYMLVGLTAMIGATASTTDASASSGGGANGVSAILFYLVAYGLATTAAFAVIGCLQVHGEEADTFEDLDGLSNRHPFLSGVMLLSILSMIGLPPMAGFVGKLYLFSAAIDSGFVILVVVGVINSAISVAYYLRILDACFFGHEHGQFEHIPEAEDARPVVDKLGSFLGMPLAQIVIPILARRTAAFIAIGVALYLGIAGGALASAARDAVKLGPPEISEVAPAAPVTPPAAVAKID